MSGVAALARVFGSKKGAPPSPQEAIGKLRETEDMLNKKSEFLEKKIEEQTILAKKHGLKNKKTAINALRKKKRLEKQLQQIDGTISTVEFQREALENAHTNTEVLKNMGYAAKALKAAHQHLDADDVYDLVDDIQEQNELAAEITDALSSPFAQNLDEDDLLAELEEMEQSELQLQLMSLETAVPKLPEVPVSLGKINSKTSKSDDPEVKKLADWAT